MNANNDESIEASGIARLLIVVVIILMTALLLLFVQQLEATRLTENVTPQEISLAVDKFRRLIHYLLIVTVLFSLVFSGYSFRLARRTTRHGMFPPPGTLVLRKTAILHGDSARRVAMRIYIFATLIWLTVLIPVYLEWMLDKIVAKS